MEKVSSGFLLLISLTSNDGKLDDVALSDYLARNVMNEIKRLDGVGKAQLYGAERAMRIWIDPQKLIGFNLTPADVYAAIVAQNAQVSAGSIVTSRPVDSGITATILVKGQLSTPQEFADIVLKPTRTVPPCVLVMWRGSRSAVRTIISAHASTASRPPLSRAIVAGRQRAEHRDAGAGEDG